jgi:hypothetical protein
VRYKKNESSVSTTYTGYSVMCIECPVSHVSIVLCEENFKSTRSIEDL